MIPRATVVIVVGQGKKQATDRESDGVQREKSWGGRQKENVACTEERERE